MSVVIHSVHLHSHSKDQFYPEHFLRFRKWLDKRFFCSLQQFLVIMQMKKFLFEILLTNQVFSLHTASDSSNYRSSQKIDVVFIIAFD